MECRERCLNQKGIEKTYKIDLIESISSTILSRITTRSRLRGSEHDMCYVEQRLQRTSKLLMLANMMELMQTTHGSSAVGEGQGDLATNGKESIKARSRLGMQCAHVVIVIATKSSRGLGGANPQTHETHGWGMGLCRVAECLP